MMHVKYYKATSTDYCWKQHRCVACNSTFRYLFRTSQTANGLSTESAAWAAERNLEFALYGDVAYCPCPVCGTYQPEMIGQHQYDVHGRLLLSQTAILAILFAASRVAGVQHVTAPLAAVVAGLLCASHMWVALRDRNANLAANLAHLQRTTAGTGRIVLVDERGHQAELAGRAGRQAIGAARLAGVVLLLAGTVVYSLMALNLAGGAPWYTFLAGIGAMDIAAYMLRRAGLQRTYEGLPTVRIAVTGNEEVGNQTPGARTTVSQEWM